MSNRDDLSYLTRLRLRKADVEKALAAEQLGLIRRCVDALCHADAEVAQLRAALENVRYKAGSHTVTVSGEIIGDENDPGFAGIYAVADNALK